MRRLFGGRTAGARITESFMYTIYKETTFSGAHRLREYKGRCEALHGHNWKVRAYVSSGELDELGMVMDFKELSKALEDAASHLDHKYINEVPPFDTINPSAENIARFFYDELSARLKNSRAGIEKVMIWESESSCAIYQP